MTRFLTWPQNGISEISVHVLPLGRKSVKQAKIIKELEKAMLDMKSLFNRTLTETCKVTNLCQDLRY